MLHWGCTQHGVTTISFRSWCCPERGSCSRRCWCLNLYNYSGVAQKDSSIIWSPIIVQHILLVVIIWLVLLFDLFLLVNFLASNYTPPCMLLLKSAIRVSSPEFTKHHNLFDSIMCQSPGPNSLAVGFAVKTFGSSLEQYLQSKKLFCHDGANLHILNCQRSLQTTSSCPQSRTGGCPQLHWADAISPNTNALWHYSGLLVCNSVRAIWV